MQINSDRLKKALIRDEGFIPHAYQDSEGYWTIGIGRLVDKKMGGGITEDEAKYLLDNDINKYSKELLKARPTVASLDDVRQEVLINMCFNLGINRLNGFKNMWSAIERNDYARAADEMLDSKWAVQVGLRAVRLSEAMRTGKFNVHQRAP